MDFDEHGQCVGLCFTADMSRVCLPEQQRSILDFDRVTIMQVYMTAAARRAAVVKVGDLLTKADIQANPVKVSKVPCTEFKTRFDKQCFNIEDISQASNVMTSRYA